MLDMTASFPEFVAAMRPRLLESPYVASIAGVLDRVARGELKRAMILTPPRHGRTTIATLFAAYYRQKWSEPAVSYYTCAAAYTSGADRKIRKHPGSGDLFCSGIGSASTGRCANLTIIDNTILSRVEARQEHRLHAIEEWYDNDVVTRESDDAAQVLFDVRWRQRDLIGRLLERERYLDVPERWHVVHFPMIRDGETPRYVPPTCTVEPDSRPIGEPLRPEEYSREYTHALRQRIDVGAWQSLYALDPLD